MRARAPGPAGCVGAGAALQLTARSVGQTNKATISASLELPVWLRYAIRLMSQPSPDPNQTTPREAAANAIGSSPSTPAAAQQSPVVGLITLVCIGIGIWYTQCGGMEIKVAHDAEQNYRTAKQAGSPQDACAHAGLVVAAWIQANDPQQVTRWKKIEGCDCAQANFIRLPECNWARRQA